jgi:hypothetical protein
VRFLDQRAVEEPECNVHVEGYEVDFLWRRAGLLAGLVQAGVRAASWPRASSYSPPRRARISSARAT